MKKKTVLVGITGGIAVYKTASLVRLLVKAGYNVIAVMTANAMRFVAPLTFETLTGNPVVCDTFEKAAASYGTMEHISLADQTDLFVCAPATANFIGKIASGIADDVLTTTVMALKPGTPKLIFPAMNVNMYENPATSMNMQRLASFGYHVFEPDKGELACGVDGRGRLPEPEYIKKQCDRYLSPDDLRGKRILVTAGATKELIDPVRYITNRSSGKMGVSIAEAAWRRGADVSLVSGEGSVKSDVVYQAAVSTSEAMWASVKALLDKGGYDFIVMAAAVSDYRPDVFSDAKIKKGDAGLVIRTERTRDIAMSVRDSYDVDIIGFAAESEELLKNARAKLHKKGFKMIVANNISETDAGFGSDDNRCLFVDEKGTYNTGLKSKRAIAELICDYMAGKLRFEGECSGE